MRKLLMGAMLLFVAAMSKAQTLDVERQLSYCHEQIVKALDALRQPGGSYDFTREPRNILHNDKQKGWNCREAKAEEWCSGFWPGILWMDYSYTHDEAVRKAAEGYTESLAPIAYRPAFDHDLGFLMFCSFGKGWEQTHSNFYKQIVLASADTLATLFNPLVGTILSWPREVKPRNWPHNTIMDNMMNLEMLLWASRNGGNKLLYDIAVQHAKTTMEHHFRPDGSGYHVAVYDTLTGKFIKGVTHQGYADNSMWARGQSWAIYGYTMMYRYTRLPIFLQHAEKVTDAYLKALSPELMKVVDNGQATPLMLQNIDLIPAWDFADPRKQRAPKDASAACVVADALLELSQFVGGQKGLCYRDIALATLAQLSTDKYLSGERNVAFLMHSTGHHPAGSEIDASIIYADYYYLEALLRAKEQTTR